MAAGVEAQAGLPPAPGSGPAGSENVVAGDASATASPATASQETGASDAAATKSAAPEAAGSTANLVTIPAVAGVKGSRIYTDSGTLLATLDSGTSVQLTGRSSDGEDAVNQKVIFDNLNPYYFDPDSQPGGGRIVFQIKGAAQTDLWVVNTDGTGKTALTQPRTTLVDTLPSNVAPAYSPDGRHIVFLSKREADKNAGEWRLWVMNAAGSRQRQLPLELAIDHTYGLEQVVSWGGQS